MFGALTLGQMRLGRLGGIVPAWQQILNLASDDGWTAVYDPTNPNTRTLRESGGDQFITQIEDGLGNLPALAQATEANQPQLSVGAFGKLDGTTLNGSSHQLSTTSFSANLLQPNFQTTIARDDGGGTAQRSLIHAITGSNRNVIQTINADRLLQVFAGNNGLTSLTMKGDLGIIGALFNSSSSEAWLNSASSGVIDVGLEDMGSLRIGTNAGETEYWNGLAGLVLIFNGEPSVEVRTRMFDLLHSLTGIAKAA